MNPSKLEIIENLAIRVSEISGDSMNDIDRSCWMAVHEYLHGVMPSEYDIREIDEELYLALLKRVRELN